MRFMFLTVFLLISLNGTDVLAKELQGISCASDDTTCLLMMLDDEIAKIENERWRDQTFREQAKLLTLEGKVGRALSVINKVQNPDTKAMTIRGIGMAAAESKFTPDDYNTLFKALRTEADKIEHPPSYAIALTYIAMSQAFAGDDTGAMATAKDMENNALRNKALGENAEIQAERGDLQAAMDSIAIIDSSSFKDKAYKLVSKIFTDQKMYDEALQSAKKIENHYQRSQAILELLTKQIKPEEVSIK